MPPKQLPYNRDGLFTNLTAEFLVSERCGVIDKLRERRSSVGASGIFDFVSIAAHQRELPKDLHAVYGGESLIRQKARAAAVGEAIERYCLGMPPFLDETMSEIQDKPDAGCSLKELHWFLPQQYQDPDFPLEKPKPDWQFRWSAGHSLCHSKTVAIPSSLIYLPYYPLTSERLTTFQTSVGTSCAYNFETAASRAVLELVERDSLTICWESRVAFPPICQDDIKLAIGDVYDELPVSLKAFDLSTDVEIPVVLALAMADHGGPAVAIGTAADLCAENALSRALTEAITSWHSASYLKSSLNTSNSKLIKKMSTGAHIPLHSLYYSSKESAKYFNYLLNSELNTKPISECGISAKSVDDKTNPSKELNECRKRLFAAGCEAVLFDLTQQDVAQTGLHVVRAVSLSLVRPTISLAGRHLANHRIGTVPWKLGYIDKPVANETLLAVSYPTP